MSPMQVLFYQGRDAFASTTSFLNISEVAKLRLVSKAAQRAVDSDAVWAMIIREQLSFLRIVPLGKCGGWRQFVQRLELHQPSLRLQQASSGNLVDGERDAAVAAVRTALNDAGKWVTVASVAPTIPTTNNSTTTASYTHPQFHAGSTALLDMIAGPKSLAAKQPSTCSVGVVLTAGLTPLSAESALSIPFSSSNELMTLLSVQQQVLEFLQLSTARPESLVRELIAKPVAESVASLEVFNAAPHCGRDGSHRMVFLLRVTNEARANPTAVGLLLQAMMNTCSSIQFVGPDQATISQFCGWYGSTLPTVPAAPFSTGANTPSVAFTISSPSSCSPPMELSQFIPQNSDEMNSWIFNRTCSVGTGYLDHKNLFSLAKPLHCPSWVNPAVTATISPATILQMIKSFVTPPPLGGDALLSPWEVSVMRFHCDPEERRIRSFYENAIRTEFDHHTRPDSETAYLAEIPTPMDPLLMVEAHNLYFYAAIRKYGYALPVICGRDCQGGMKLLEVLKRNVSDVFRTFWRRNNEFSRNQCHAVFNNAFGPIASKFYDIEHSPLLFDAKRRGLKQWYTAIGDKIMEYELKAKGLRKFDILSEELNDRVFPQLLQFVQQNNANVPRERICTHEEDAQRAIADLRQIVIDRTAAYDKGTNGTLNTSQHESALYTAAMSNELASLQSKSAVEYLKSIEEDADAWEQACLWRIRSLTTIPKNMRSSQAQHIAGESSTSSAMVATGKHEMEGIFSTGGGSRHAPLTSSSSDGNGSVAALDDISLASERGENDGESTIMSDVGEFDCHDEEEGTHLSRCAEERGQVLSEGLAEELDRRSQASRIAARLDQQKSVFDVVARERSKRKAGGTSQASAAVDRVKSAWKKFWN
jgi:hypothetical protein